MRNNTIYFRRNGFTLLELLIALFIFTIVSMIMVTALHTVLTSQAATEKQASRLTELQTALLFLSRDIEQTINRPIISSKDAIENFIGTSDSITFTHAGLTNPLGQLNRSTLQRTQYMLNKDHFIRITWPVLEQTNKTQANSRILLQHVETLLFEYLDDKGKLHDQWPPSDNRNAILPQAVRVTLQIHNWGKLTQTYLIPATTPLPTTHTNTPTTNKESMTYDIL